MSGPGRSCPNSYRYRPADLLSPTLTGETVYVVGGLYGNSGALEEILAMAARDPSGLVTVVFNGDFNWLNVDPDEFRIVNDSVLARHAIQGNVEAELNSPDSRAGCGCGYPDYVDDRVVERSNAIMQRLQATSRKFPAVARRLSDLPRYLTVDMGGERVAIIHGDPESLAGWGLALEAMEPTDEALRHELRCGDHPTTSARRIEAWFREAGVRVFASTHTGLPFAQDFLIEGRRHIVMNNGSAGLPNFQGGRYGVITRISLDPRPCPDSLYGLAVDSLRCDALPVRFDSDRWVERFLEQWPPGTPGHDSYLLRITQGTHLRIEQAARGNTSVARSNGRGAVPRKLWERGQWPLRQA